MQFFYDQKADALDILLGEGLVARTEQIDEGTLVDLDAQGDVVAIELIRPGRRWPLEEIIARFDIPKEDAEMLRALWSERSVYPYAERREVLAASTTEVLV